jgi:hypothetical protein
MHNGVQHSSTARGRAGFWFSGAVVVVMCSIPMTVSARSGGARDVAGDENTAGDLSPAVYDCCCTAQGCVMCCAAEAVDLSSQASVVQNSSPAAAALRPAVPSYTDTRSTLSMVPR